MLKDEIPQLKLLYPKDLCRRFFSLLNCKENADKFFFSKAKSNFNIFSFFVQFVDESRIVMYYMEVIDKVLM